MSSCLWCQNEKDQIGERERGLWVVTIKVATAYCVCSGKLPSLHTLATYTQVKCPSTNKEIFILWMVFFFIVQKIYKTTTLFQDIKSTLNSMCRIGAFMCILCSVHIWFVIFYFGTILSAICMHIFTFSAKHIKLNWLQWILNVSVDSCVARDCIDWLKV